MLFEYNSAHKLQRLEKKPVMKRRDKIHTKIPEALVTSCCVKKGKRGTTHHLIWKLFN